MQGLRLVLVFFFSSRRRHTRYIGDWSSDVCSSDLSKELTLARRARRASVSSLESTLVGPLGSVDSKGFTWMLTPLESTLAQKWGEGWRSEERRVGKVEEWRRCGRWRYRDRAYETGG